MNFEIVCPELDHLFRVDFVKFIIFSEHINKIVSRSPHPMFT
jgi:hypothetical protein